MSKHKSEESTLFLYRSVSRPEQYSHDEQSLVPAINKHGSLDPVLFFSSSTQAAYAYCFNNPDNMISATIDAKNGVTLVLLYNPPEKYFTGPGPKMYKFNKQELESESIAIKKVEGNESEWVSRQEVPIHLSKEIVEVDFDNAMKQGVQFLSINELPEIANEISSEHDIKEDLGYVHTLFSKIATPRTLGGDYNKVMGGLIKAGVISYLNAKHNNNPALLEIFGVTPEDCSKKGLDPAQANAKIVEILKSSPQIADQIEALTSTAPTTATVRGSEAGGAAEVAPPTTNPSAIDINPAGAKNHGKPHGGMEP